jgi:hypothetical protein
MHTQNVWWYVDMGFNIRSIYGGCPPDMLHNYFLGMMKNAVIYSLTLILEFGRAQGARAGARPMEILNRGVQQLGKTSERRLPQI